MRVLVTGGAGFIGSHAVVALMEAGHEPVVVDNLTNAQPSVLRRVGEIVGSDPEFHQTDVGNPETMAGLASTIDACLHFAALKAVGESVENPLIYYQNNVGGAVTLLKVLLKAGVTNFVFSSSATVYGDSTDVPFTEETPLGAPANPYGQTKVMMEQVLRDVAAAHPDWSVCLLRYFNPVGAHASGLIGEDPLGTPSNLMPYAAKVADGVLPYLPVFGDDYPTPDGTGVRDYVHVSDLARGHVSALDVHVNDPGVHVYNLGTGKGHSVLDVIASYELAARRPIPYRVVERRAGDVAESWADVSKAETGLGWRAECDLTAMCEDSWRWQRKSADYDPGLGRTVGRRSSLD